MSEIALPLDILQSPIEQRMAERQALLDAFAEQPNEDAIWDTAFSWIKAEGDDGNGQATADTLPGDELIKLATTVRSTAPEDRYALMAGRASNGQRWFDVIQGFSSNQVRLVQKEIISSWVNQGDAPVLFHRALDLGTGTGKSLETLETNAENVIGLDRNPALLSIAKERTGEHTTLVQASVDALPFDNASFDLIASLGLHAALDKEMAAAFYRELARVMVPGGVYIASFYYPGKDDQPHEELAGFTATSKAMLTDMIGDTVSGALEVTDHLEGKARDLLLSKLGLSEENYDILSKDGVTHNLVTIVRKNFHEDNLE